jgi:hypothetical protein
MAKKGAKCQICGSKAVKRELCSLCDSMTRTSKNKAWGKDVHPEAEEKALQFIGGGDKTSKKRWDSFKSSVLTTDLADWAKLDEKLDPVLSFPCSIDKGLQICSDLENGVRLTSEDRSILHQGFEMINNIRLSFLYSKVIINGRILPNAIPVASIIRMLFDEKIRLGWDINKLVMAVASIQLPQGNNIEDRFQFRRRQRRRHADRDSLLATLSWIEWMAEENILPPENYRIHPLSVWARGFRNNIIDVGGRLFHETVNAAFLNHPNGLSELSKYPWVEQWQEYQYPSLHNESTKWPLKIFGMNLRLLVRTKSNGTRLAVIPDNPAIWASLITLSFSPSSSLNGHLLYSIQYNWTHQKEIITHIKPPLRRSIQLLNEVISGNPGEVYINQDTILVIGRLGHFYEVKVGEGAHGAPYTIRYVKSLKPRKTRLICIHSGRFHSNLPLGDIIASVVLSLIDDINTSEKVESLRSELISNQPIGFPSLLSEEFIKLIGQEPIDAFVKIVSRTNSSHPKWLSRDENEWSRIEEEGFGPAERVRQQFNFIMRRNRYFVELGEQTNKAESEIDESRGVIGNDLEQGNPAPSRDKLVKIWRETFTALPEETNRQGRGGQFERFWNHHHNRGRRDWMFLRNHGRPEHEHPIGDIRNGERRYCEVIPRVWEALMLQPIGSRVILPTVVNREITFQHCQLRVTLRDLREIRLMKRILVILGYRADEGDQLEREQVYYRRNHPHLRNRRMLTQALTSFQRRVGARGAPPWWWHYADVVEPPQEVPEYRWQLQEDLSDTNIY